VEKQYQLDEVVRVSEKEKDDLGRQVHVLLLEESSLMRQLEEGERVRELCHAEMGDVVPILSKAVQGLQNLDARDIDELRSLKHPPKPIVTLLKGVCYILRVEPKMVPVPDKIKEYTEDYWTPSVGPKVLGNRSITQFLGSIDPTTLDAGIMVKLENLMDDESFSFVTMERSCKAAHGLFMWIRAVRNYFFVFK
jgi:dynein heavy chain